MDNYRKVAVLGGGGHSKVVVDTLLKAGFHIGGIFDDDPKKIGEQILNFYIEGTIEDAYKKGFKNAIIAIGDNRIREKISNKYDFNWVSAIHPHSYVHPSVKIGKGTVIFAGVIIQPDAFIKDHVIINTGASVDHDCFVGNFVHIAPGVHLAGGVKVKKGAFLGISSTVIPNKIVGEWVVVGAGGVVIKDVDDYNKVVGIPAKKLK